MSCVIKSKGLIIINMEKTIGITRQDNLELKGYTRVEYKEFIDSMAWKALKDKADYSIRLIHRAKKILEAFDYELHECDIICYNTDKPEDRLPLIIYFDEYAIVIAPKINVGEQ